MNDALVPILIVAGVVVLGLLMRQFSRPDPDATEASRTVVRDEDDDGENAAMTPEILDAPVTADGVVLLRRGTEVRLLASEEDDESDPPPGFGAGGGTATATAPGEGPARGRHRPTGLVLNAGDFTAARVGREPGEGWRLETLGRDGEFAALVFDMESTARKALTLLEEAGVVRRPIGDDGEPVPSSPEDFEEARRRFEETEKALALGTDDDEPAPPNDWSSRR